MDTEVDESTAVVDKIRQYLERKIPAPHDWEVSAEWLRSVEVSMRYSSMATGSYDAAFSAIFAHYVYPGGYGDGECSEHSAGGSVLRDIVDAIICADEKSLKQFQSS